jgi:hypothetical protein
MERLPDPDVPLKNADKVRTIPTTFRPDDFAIGQPPFIQEG